MSLPDKELFDQTQTQQRALITENVPDFITIDATYRTESTPHWGLIFTTNKQFPRGNHRTTGALITALHNLLTNTPTPTKPTSTITWLQKPKK